MSAPKRLKADNSLCRDCQACVLACSLVHEGQCSPSLARLRVGKNMHQFTFDILYCRNCESPACVAACPSSAIVPSNGGIPILDDELCTRCGSCVEACPFDAIFYNKARNRYFKCDLCSGHRDGPLCVRVCPVGVLTLVDRQAPWTQQQMLRCACDR